MNSTIDEFGPVDYLVVEFPAGHTNFTGEGARELARLVESQTIRVLDLLILTKNDDGSVDALEIDDVEQADEVRELESEMAELLSVDDVANLAESMAPGTTAAALVYENRWAAPFASALRRAGGQLIADGRIPIQAVLASLEAEDAALS